MTSSRIGITGCTGRVGTLLAMELEKGGWDGMELAGGSVRAGSSAPRKDGFFTTSDPDVLFGRSDIVIDFTAPEATVNHARLAAKHRKPLIVGTTGLKTAHEKKLREAARECPIVYAANMSIGVNLLLALVEQAAKRLGPEWDIEINETHHRHKVDAPSGTALALGRAAAAGRTVDLSTHAVMSREGHTGARAQSTIGFSVQRGGDVAGEHTVSFFGTGERVELAHRATDRAIFARGALQAARWIAGKPPGLYSMRDVLSL